MTNFDNSDKLIKDLKERILALEVADRNYEMELQDREKTIEDQKNTIDLLSQIRKILIAENNELKDKALESCGKDREIVKFRRKLDQLKREILDLEKEFDSQLKGKYGI